MRIDVPKPSFTDSPVKKCTDQQVLTTKRITIVSIHAKNRMAGLLSGLPEKHKNWYIVQAALASRYTGIPLQ